MRSLPQRVDAKGEQRSGGWSKQCEANSGANESSYTAGNDE
jgi:hypothetical protein